ncbi:MAG: hypothetical protein Q9170_002419 [Blastenia crenularia]
MTMDMIDSNGMLELQTPADATVDICFVHGLGGGNVSTWKLDKVYWPLELLTKDIPKARILSFGYDSDVIKPGSKVSQNGLKLHAANLMAALVGGRDKLNERPLIFIVHSLGGLALLDAHKGAEEPNKAVEESARRICFLATPFRGSDKVPLLEVASKLAGLFCSTNPAILSGLKQHGYQLEEIAQDFPEWLRKREAKPNTKVEIVCYMEEIVTGNFGKASYETCYQHDAANGPKIVTDDSARIDGYPLRSLHANHTDICKFSGKEDDKYKTVLGVLRQWVDDLKESSKVKNPEEVSYVKDEPKEAPLPVLLSERCIRPINIRLSNVERIGGWTGRKFVMGESDPVPTYTPTPADRNITTTLHAIANPANQATQRQIVQSFFTAIESKQSEVVAAMIESGLVTANTKDENDRTPLIAATAAENVRMVQELVDFDADVNAWGKYEEIDRTPLMVAASNGNMTLAKLFVDVFHPDDALIAPDGQLALRLAVEGGWREMIDFLPLRRGGGWRRWKTHHTLAVKRVKKAVKGIYSFLKVLLWEAPRFFVWTVPREIVFDPVKEGAEWCWKYRKDFGPWCKRKIQRAPKWFKEVAIEITRRARRTIEAVPGFCRKLFVCCQSLLTVRIPAALKTFAQWLWRGIKSVGQSFLSVILQVVSFLHTLLIAMASFFRHITMKDVWDAFNQILHTVFVDFPSRLWSWACKFEEMSYKVMEYLGGVFGEILWWIGRGFIWAAVYVPKQIWIIVSSLGGSVAKACHEFTIWVDPKR